ncbi:MAG: hypothetical protein U0805_16260 [Pirellulales bacterium]
MAVEELNLGATPSNIAARQMSPLSRRIAVKLLDSDPVTSKN